MIYIEEYNVHAMSRPREIEYIVTDTGCWVCISHALDKDGYPKIKRNKTCLRLHRYIYTINYGDIPSELMVMHLCDNPSCINPEHLSLGTSKNNNRYRWDNGRGRMNRDDKGKFTGSF